MDRKRIPEWSGLLLGVLAALLLSACQSATPQVTTAAAPVTAAPTEVSSATQAPAATEAPTVTEAPTAVPEGQRSVTIKDIKGTVEVIDSEGAAPRTPVVGDIVAQGATVRTGADGQAILALDDGTAVVVSANTEFQVTEVSGTTQNPITRFFMNIGKIFAFHEGRLSDTAAFEVETPSGVAAIRGSSLGLSYDPAGTSRTDGPRYGRRVGQDGTVVAVLICLEGSCTFKGPDGSLITLQGGQKVEIAADGTVSGILPVTDADLEGAFNAFGDAQNVGLIGGMNRDQFIFITPTPTTEPAQPPPVPVSTFTPTVDPSLSYIDFDVFNCTGIGNGQFTWISVRITYKDGQAVNVIQTGGPFTGSWVPGCPPVDNAHQLCGDNICGPGEDTNNCPQDCAAYETCGNGICAGGENSDNCPQDCKPPENKLTCDPYATTKGQCGDGTWDSTYNYCDCTNLCGKLGTQSKCDAHSSDWYCYWDSFYSVCTGGG